MGILDTIEAGSQIDSYRIEAPVARSGMASIFRAVDTRDNRVVALKIPHPDMEADPILFDRFKREADIGEKLDHPMVMRVYGGEKRSRSLHGDGVVRRPRCCAQILTQGRMPQDRAIRIAIEVLDALEYIHGQGVVHRDLKPENIMVDARRQHQAHRLRNRRRCGRSPPDLRQLHRHAWDRGLYLARTGEGQARRRTLGHLFHGHHPVRDAHGATAVLRNVADGDHERPAAELPAAPHCRRPVDLAATAGGALSRARTRSAESICTCPGICT